MRSLQGMGRNPRFCLADLGPIAEKVHNAPFCGFSVARPNNGTAEGVKAKDEAGKFASSSAISARTVNKLVI
jgi:hypothetical protein